MPRCCATISDPNDASTVIVYCEVDSAEEAAGIAAARAAATSAYGAANAGAAPAPETFTLPGQLTRAKLQANKGPVAQ